jgi:hypothetical protein
MPAGGAYDTRQAVTYISLKVRDKCLRFGAESFVTGRLRRMLPGDMKIIGCMRMVAGLVRWKQTQTVARMAGERAGAAQDERC